MFVINRKYIFKFQRFRFYKLQDDNLIIIYKINKQLMSENWSPTTVLPTIEQNEKAKGKSKAKNTTSTKNNIRHFAPVIKRILALFQRKNPIIHQVVRQISRKLDKATSLKKFSDCYSSPIIRKILQQSVESGLFIRLFMEADIYDSNKVRDLKFLNVLFESFYTGKLDRWVYYNDRSPVATDQSENSSIQETKRDNTIENFEAPSKPIKPARYVEEVSEQTRFLTKTTQSLNFDGLQEADPAFNFSSEQYPQLGDQKKSLFLEFGEQIGHIQIQAPFEMMELHMVAYSLPF